MILCIDSSLQKMVAISPFLFQTMTKSVARNTCEFLMTISAGTSSGTDTGIPEVDSV